MFAASCRLLPALSSLLFTFGNITRLHSGSTR